MINAWGLRHECKTLRIILVVLILYALVHSQGVYAASTANDWLLDLFHPPITRGIIVNLPAFRLHLIIDSQLVKSYPIAVGRLRTQTDNGWVESETPVGKYSITALVVDPSWYPPGWLKEARGWPADYVVRAGPDNPLGVRWIGLSLPGYGIHGTNNPTSIGGSVSLGCIRMQNEAVVEVFSQVHVGDPVWIVHNRASLYPDPDTSEPTLALYPDLYGSASPDAVTLEAILRRTGYPVTPARIDTLVAHSSDEPQQMVLRQPNSLVVNGRTVGRVVVDEGGNGDSVQAVYVPVRPAVEALGMDVLYVDESHVTTDEQQLITGEVVDGHFVASLEALVQALHINGQWDPVNRELHLWGVRVDLFGYAATRDAYIEDGKTYVNIQELANGRLSAYFQVQPDGTALILGVPIESTRRNDRTYVSLRAIATRFGANLYWNPGQGTATVSYR